MASDDITHVTRFAGCLTITGRTHAPDDGIELVVLAPGSGGMVAATFEVVDAGERSRGLPRKWRYFIPLASIERLWIEEPYRSAADDG